MTIDSNMQNPILKNIKDGDVVLMEMESRYDTPHRNLVRLSNVEYIPAGTEHEGSTFDFDWLEYDADVLYTNKKMHSSWLDKGVCNCLGITEIVEEELIEKYVQTYNMFDAKKYTVSDEEAERNYKRAQRMLI